MVSTSHALKEKFHLHVDFFEEDMDVDIHATPFHISCAIAQLAGSLAPEMLGGVITMLSNMLDEKASSN